MSSSRVAKVSRVIEDEETYETVVERHFGVFSRKVRERYDVACCTE